MEPQVSSARQADECHDDDDCDLSAQQLPVNPVANEGYDEDDSDEEFLPSLGGGSVVRTPLGARTSLRSRNKAHCRGT